MSSSNGFVYALTFDGRTKIGRCAKNPHVRVNAICSQAGIHRSRAEVFWYATGDYYKVEVALHRKLKEFRLYGEYFSISHQDAIKEIMKAAQPLSLDRDNHNLTSAVVEITSSFQEAHRRLDERKANYDVSPVGVSIRSFGVAYEIGYGGCLVHYPNKPLAIHDCFLDAFLNEKIGMFDFCVEHEEDFPGALTDFCWDAIVDSDSVDARMLQSIAMAEKTVDIAIRDGIKAAMPYKEIFQMAKARVNSLLPALGLKP